MAAAGRCAVTAPGIVCGRSRYRTDNKIPDIGNQMNVMSVVQNNLTKYAPKLADLRSGTSGDNVGGGGNIERPSMAQEVLAKRPIANC